MQRRTGPGQVGHLEALAAAADACQDALEAAARGDEHAVRRLIVACTSARDAIDAELEQRAPTTPIARPA